ncbi:MAG: Lacal_2735 family protein [Cyclobacteriaceae bacterium]
MFGLFKKKTELEKLQEKYKKLLAESHSLSQRDRKAGDMKMAEAEEVAKQIDELRARQK